MNAGSSWLPSSMRHRRCNALIDKAAFDETVEAEGLGDGMRPVVENRVSEDEARARNRLEAAGAPAAIDIESLDIGLADDRRAVAGHVDDAAPHAQHAQSRDDRKGLHQRRHRML